MKTKKESEINKQNDQNKPDFNFNYQNIPPSNTQNKITNETGINSENEQIEPYSTYIDLIQLEHQNDNLLQPTQEETKNLIKESEPNEKEHQEVKSSNSSYYDFEPKFPIEDLKLAKDEDVELAKIQRQNLVKEPEIDQKETINPKATYCDLIQDNEGSESASKSTEHFENKIKPLNQNQQYEECVSENERNQQDNNQISEQAIGEKFVKPLNIGPITFEDLEEAKDEMGEKEFIEKEDEVDDEKEKSDNHKEKHESVMDKISEFLHLNNIMNKLK